MSSSPSDPCSPASEASTSASSEPVCALCGSASRTPSASESLPGIGPESRAIPTCAPLWRSPRAAEAQHAGRTAWPKAGQTLGLVEQATGAVCPCRCHTSTSSAAGSPARTSASPAAGPDWPENARVFGGSSQGSLGNYDPATSSLRTSQLSLIEDSTSSLRILPRAGSMRSGTIFQRRPLAPLTGVTGFGSWPTPKTSDANGHSAREVVEGNPHSQLVTEVQINPWPTPVASNNRKSRKTLMASQGNSQRTTGIGHSSPPGLEQAVEMAAGILPRELEGLTPDDVGPATQKLWPTPTARLGAARGPQAKRYHDPARSNDLDDAVAASGTPGSLNPTWVEWLMGYPLGWTDCEPSATASSPRSPNGSAGESSNGKDSGQ